MSALTLYYDGACPLCVGSMASLRRRDAQQRLAFVDISTPGFDPAPLATDLAALGREIHARTARGEILIGIDAIVAAHALIGAAWMVWPLRVRALRPLWTALYRSLARNRQRVSRWLGLHQPACRDGVCQHWGRPW